MVKVMVSFKSTVDLSKLQLVTVGLFGLSFATVTTRSEVFSPAVVPL